MQATTGVIHAVRCWRLSKHAGLGITTALRAVAISAGILAPFTTFAANSSGDVLEEVVVTAQKRSEDLQSVPIAVSVVDAELATVGGVTNTLALPSVVPGLQTIASVGSMMPHLRGVGNTATGPGIENSVATYIDDVYYGAAPSTLLSLEDAQQIAVLKGPQGTLFGRNATGGVVQVTTKGPSREFAADGSLGYGNYETLQASAFIAGPLSDALSASLATQGAWQGEGWGKNLLDGKPVNRIGHNYTVRGKLHFAFGDSTALRFSADYGNSGDSFGTFRNAPGLAVGLPGGIGYVNSPKKWDTDASFPNNIAYSGGGLSGKLDHEFGLFNFTSITAYRSNRFHAVFDVDGGPVDGRNIDMILRDKQLTEEVQLTSKESAGLKWVAGLFYLHDDYETNPQNITQAGPFIQPAFPLAVISNVGVGTTRSFAVFGQGTAAVAERTNLTLGLRYTTEDRTIVGTTTGVLANGFPVGNLAPPANTSQSFNKITWRIALDRKFSENVLGYISNNRGFKSGGYNTTIPSAPAFDPEVIDSYEIGIKSDLLQQRLRLNTAAFYSSYKNIQVAKFETGTIGVYNGAEARIYGLDVDMQAAVGRGFSIKGGLELLSATFTSFPNALGSIPVNGGLLLTILPGGSLPGVNAKGNDLPSAPHLSGFLSLNKEVSAGQGSFVFNLTNYWNSGYYTESDNFLKQSSYDLLNASVRWDLNDSWSMTLWGNNLLEEAVATQMSTLASTYVASYGSPPRTFGLKLQVRLGAERK